MRRITIIMKKICRLLLRKNYVIYPKEIYPKGLLEKNDAIFQHYRAEPPYRAGPPPYDARPPYRAIARRKK